jgi:hypothetical protein
MNREQEFFMNCAVVTIQGGSNIAEDGAVINSGAALAARSATVATLHSSPILDVNDANTTGPSISPVVNEAVNEPVNEALSQPMNEAVNELLNEAVNEPVNEAVNQPGNDAVNKPVNEAVNDYRCESQSSNQNREWRARCRNRSKLRKSRARSTSPMDGSMMHNVQRASPMPFSLRPKMLFANVDNGCTSPKTYFELKYPNPGPDVVEGDGEYPLELPSGTC